MSSVTSRLSAEAARLAEQADELSHKAGETLHDAASSIREGGQRGSKVIAAVVKNTAAKLDGAGSFVEEHDMTNAIGESRQLVRRYPMESLVLAAGVGFLTGFAMRRLTHACAATVARSSE
jgi:ElaB/YqjD/DUF883 family membrane-anchored ribosome-binding protein